VLADCLREHCDNAAAHALPSENSATPSSTNTSPASQHMAATVTPFGFQHGSQFHVAVLQQQGKEERGGQESTHAFRFHAHLIWFAVWLHVLFCSATRSSGYMIAVCAHALLHSSWLVLPHLVFKHGEEGGDDAGVLLHSTHKQPETVQTMSRNACNSQPQAH
jgi:hypothetical protein